MEPIILVLVMVLGLWFLVIMPQRRRQKRLQKTVEALRPGTRVMLAGGMFGTVATIGEKTLQVEIAPGVEVEVVKQAIIETVETPAVADDPRTVDGPEAPDDSQKPPGA